MLLFGNRTANNMKALFLLLLVSAAIAGEMLIIAITPSWGPVITYALFCLSLFAYWRASYLLEGTRSDRASNIAHAVMMLSFGVYFIWTGVDSVLSSTCSYSPPNGAHTRWSQELAAVTNELQAGSWCSALGFALILVGGGFLWPTMSLVGGRRLFTNLMLRQKKAVRESTQTTRIEPESPKGTNNDSRTMDERRY